MYGMVNKALEDMVISEYGEPTWESIKEKANVDVDVFVRSEGYADSITYSLVGAASEVLQLPAHEILEKFGVHWVVRTAQESYGDLMATGGRTLREFLVNLPEFHSRVSLIFPELAPPQFACSDVKEDSLCLHYKSHRAGLAPFVVGLLKGLSQLYQTPATIEHVVRKADGADHDEFLIRW